MTFLESYGPESDWLVLDLVRQNGEADLLLVFSVDPGSSTELLGKDKIYPLRSVCRSETRSLATCPVRYTSVCGGQHLPEPFPGDMLDLL